MKANLLNLELPILTPAEMQIDIFLDWRGYLLQAYIMIAVVLVGAYLYYMSTKGGGTGFRKNQKAHCENTRVSFSIEVASCPIINQYVDKMSDQFKDNSRVLNGSGKTHFTEAVAEGSDTVRSESLSILSAIGDRFS